MTRTVPFRSLTADQASPTPPAGVHASWSIFIEQMVVSGHYYRCRSHRERPAPEAAQGNEHPRENGHTEGRFWNLLDREDVAADVT